MYGDAVTDAKRTPYRDKAPVRSTPARRPRGALVTRAAHPDDEELERERIDKRAPPHDPDAGVFSGLVAPHPSSTTSEWWGQVLLTLLGLPLIATTFICVGWLDARRAYGEVVNLGRDAPRTLSIAHPIAWVFGSLPVGLACFAGEPHWTLAALAIGGPFVALLARRRLRARILERDALRALMARAKT